MFCLLTTGDIAMVVTRLGLVDMWPNPPPSFAPRRLFAPISLSECGTPRSEVRIGLAENEVGVEAIPDALTDFFYLCACTLPGTSRVQRVRSPWKLIQ